MERYLNDAINSLQWLIRLDSVEEAPLSGKPFGQGCYDALEFTLNLAKSLGFKTKNVDGYAGHADIGKGELFGILGHLDTVPHGTGWTYPPTGGVIDNNKLYGRGALDNKGPLISCLYAVKALIDDGYTPNKKIRLIFGCDEESGWKCIEHYFEKEEMPKMGFSPDADFPAINCEKGLSYYHLNTALPDSVISIKGGVRANMVPDYASALITTEPVNRIDAKVTKKEEGYLIETFGKAAHASTPDKGDNALWKLFRVLSDTLGGIFDVIHSKLTAYDGSKCSLKLSDDKSGSLTMNLGTADTEGKELKIVLDFRHPISYTRDEILSILLKELPEFQITKGNFHNPLYVPKNHPLVRELLGAYKDVTGEDAEPITIGGGTYARALPLAVAFGPIFPGQISTIHSKDEYIGLDDFLKMSKIYYEAIKRLCFDKK